MTNWLANATSRRFESFEEYLAYEDGTGKLYELFSGESRQLAAGARLCGEAAAVRRDWHTEILAGRCASRGDRYSDPLVLDEVAEVAAALDLSVAEVERVRDAAAE